MGLRLELNQKQHEKLKEVVDIHRQELLASLQNLVEPRGAAYNLGRSPAINFARLTRGKLMRWCPVPHPWLKEMQPDVVDAFDAVNWLNGSSYLISLATSI